MFNEMVREMMILTEFRFGYNLELICTSEFFQKLKLHEPLRRVQLQLFEKLIAQISFILNEEKPYDYL